MSSFGHFAHARRAGLAFLRAGCPLGTGEGPLGLEPHLGEPGGLLPAALLACCCLGVARTKASPGAWPNRRAGGPRPRWYPNPALRRASPRLSGMPSLGPAPGAQWHAAVVRAALKTRRQVLGSPQGAPPTAHLPPRDRGGGGRGFWTLGSQLEHPRAHELGVTLELLVEQL